MLVWNVVLEKLVRSEDAERGDTARKVEPHPRLAVRRGPAAVGTATAIGEH